jgi:hypothetical protein
MAKGIKVSNKAVIAGIKAGEIKTDELISNPLPSLGALLCEALNPKEGEADFPIAEEITQLMFKKGAESIPPAILRLIIANFDRFSNQTHLIELMKRALTKKPPFLG